MFTRHLVPTPLGPLHAVQRGEVLHALAYDVDRLERALHRQRVSPTPTDDVAPCAAALGRWFAGDLSALDTLEVHAHGTDFERAVWTALREIPVGTTCTYGALAARLGRPSAARAIGRANGANPLVIVVPCHRLHGADGGLVAFAGGLVRKAWLRDHEARYTVA